MRDNSGAKYKPGYQLSGLALAPCPGEGVPDDQPHVVCHLWSAPRLHDVVALQELPTELLGPALYLHRNPVGLLELEVGSTQLLPAPGTWGPAPVGKEPGTASPPTKQKTTGDKPPGFNSGVNISDQSPEWLKNLPLILGLIIPCVMVFLLPCGCQN